MGPGSQGGAGETNPEEEQTWGNTTKYNTQTTSCDISITLSKNDRALVCHI
jgi:hypothetical protein